MKSSMRFAVLTLCLLLAGRSIAEDGKPAPVPKHTTDSTDTVRKMLADKKAVLLDVREPAEWKEGHLKDARNLPLSEIEAAKDLEALLKDVPKGRAVYLHCASGRRCLKAAGILRDTGYDLRPLRDGFDDLLKAGFPEAK